MAHVAKKAECVRLRVEERLSLPEIHKLTGTPKGTLSMWLRPYPLSPDEVRDKRTQGQRPPTPREERYPSHSPFSGFMKPLHQLTRQDKGRIAEAAVLLRLTLLGLVPAKPVFDGERSDWLVELPGTATVKRIQVKWMRHTEYGRPWVRLVSVGSSGKTHRYTKTDFDVLVGYDVHTDTCHVWDWASIGANVHTVAATDATPEAWGRLLT